MNNTWDAAQWLMFLEQRSPQQNIELGLERVRRVARALNVLDPCYKIIHVAGTNGKGSTVASLETLYHTAGYRVGSYTSPHLLHFNERIKVNLQPIGDEALSHVFFVVESHRAEVNLTYFEMATLAAFLYFQEQSLDVVILETGLGGRLDATNIMNADVAVITTIDYDHQDVLGHTLDAIGQEKAGIMRAGKPVIYADIDPPQSILIKASQVDAPICLYARDFSFKENESTWSFNSDSLCMNEIPKPAVQLHAAAAALMACSLLRDTLPVSNECIYEAMRRVFIPGRLQLSWDHEHQVSVLYDVAHNPQATRLLLKKIQSITSKKQVHAVFAAMKDKDIEGIFQVLKNTIDFWYLAALDYPRAASLDYLMALGEKAGIMEQICYTSPSIAFHDALNHAKPGDLIVVFGSFFTVSHVMAKKRDIL